MRRRIKRVAIPSDRVMVSDPFLLNRLIVKKIESQSPQIGSWFLTLRTGRSEGKQQIKVAIPSDRVMVSDTELLDKRLILYDESRNPLGSGHGF